MARITDTHCHVQMPQYDGDREEVIRRALDVGVEMICVGVDLPSSRASIALAERYEGIYSSVGLHPNDNLLEAYDESAYRDLTQHPKVVAVGEIGLDYYRTTDADLKRRQRERFEKQLDLVVATGKPVIIHCRDAHDDMADILGHIGSFRGVIHSFTGTADDAQRYARLGMYLGVNGIITFTRDYDDALRSVPPEFLLLETDAPYLAPSPHRGKRNEPVYIQSVATRLAGILGAGEDEILKRAEMATQELFRITNVDIP